MRAIGTDRQVYAFSERMEPAARASRGETVVFHAQDAFGGQVKSAADVLTDLDFSRVNPATGPLFVDDAEPGDTLVVYSDGACDAANFKDEHFGRERLLDSIRRNAAYGAQRMVEEVQWDIRRFTGLAPRADDLTLLVVKVL